MEPKCSSPFSHQPVVFPESLPTYLHGGTHQGQEGLNMTGIQKEINRMHSFAKRLAAFDLTVDHCTLLMERYDVAGKTFHYVTVGYKLKS